MKRLFRATVTILCFGVGSTSLYNVLSDNTEVRSMAELVACEEHKGDVCNAQMSRMERSPFSQHFEFVTTSRTVGITCRRSLWLVGDHRCVLP